MPCGMLFPPIAKPQELNRLQKKGCAQTKNSEEHASGAKAHADSIDFFAGDKSPAYRPDEFF
jgi:hypothetical protein